MGQALLRGILRAGLLSASEILVCDVAREPLAGLLGETGVAFTNSPMEVAEKASAILVAVKPKDVPALFMDMPPGLMADKLVLSVAAGITLAQLANYLPRGARIVRVMPNTPALVGKGSSAYACESDVTAADIEFVDKVFGSVGIVRRVEETLLDAVTGLSGSGPAYVFLFMEALIDVGVHMGFSRRDAERLVTQTMRGSVEYAMHSNLHPASLRNQVTSPGGTSAAALYELEKGGLRTVMADGVWAAYRRSVELGDAQEKKDKG